MPSADKPKKLASRKPESQKPESQKPASGRPLRRRLTAFAVVGGVIVLLIAGGIVLDNWARQQVAGIVTAKVQQIFSLDSDQPVTVEVAGFSVLAQLVTGRIDRVSAGVDNVQIGDLAGGVKLTATGVPTDEARPVDRVQVEFRMSEATVQKLSSVLSASVLNKVALVEPELRIGSELTTGSFDILGVSIPGISLSIGVGLEPYAAGGRLGFTPTSVELNGNRSTAQELTDRYGALAASVLQTRTFCVARWLPVVLTLDDARVRGKELVLTIGADRQVFSEESLTRLGTCAGS